METERSTVDGLASRPQRPAFRVPAGRRQRETESNRVLLGSPRTYARLQAGQEFTYKAWIEAVRAGRTFVTNGPLLVVPA